MNSLCACDAYGGCPGGCSQCDVCWDDGDRDITNGGRITPAQMAATFTPRQAASINAKVFMLRCATDAESLRYGDRITDNDGSHRWFAYCLDTVARRA